MEFFLSYKCKKHRFNIKSSAKPAVRHILSRWLWRMILIKSESSNVCYANALVCVCVRQYLVAYSIWRLDRYLCRLPPVLYALIWHATLFPDVQGRFRASHDTTRLAVTYKAHALSCLHWYSLYLNCDRNVIAQLASTIQMTACDITMRLFISYMWLWSPAHDCHDATQVGKWLTFLTSLMVHGRSLVSTAVSWPLLYLLRNCVTVKKKKKHMHCKLNLICSGFKLGTVNNTLIQKNRIVSI